MTVMAHAALINDKKAMKAADGVQSNFTLRAFPLMVSVVASHACISCFCLGGTAVAVANIIQRKHNTYTGKKKQLTGLSSVLRDYDAVVA